MTLDDILFIDHLPTLDLHGFDVTTAELMIQDFINENQKLKNSFLVIIHGVGTGMVRKATHQLLKRNKNVVEYKLSNFNAGCTIIRIKN